jgi:hypothetical protein
MWFIIFFLLVNLIGLTALFAALVLWRRESGSSPGWLVSRWRLATLCILAAGAGLVVGAQYKLVRWIPHAPMDFFSLRLSVFLVACLALLAVGAALLVLGGPTGVSRAAHGKGPFAWSIAVALIITLTELSVFQYYNFAVILKGLPSELPSLGLDPNVSRQSFQSYRSTKITKEINPNKAYKKDYHFRVDLFSMRIPIWEKALENYRGKPNVHYLEVGLWEGGSALWVLENILTHPTARLTGIDPFLPPEGPFTYSAKEPFYSNLKLSGFEGKANIIEGFSQDELRKLPLESFDIIYIDGSHKKADVLEDAILSWRLLKDRGILIFDDYLLDNPYDYGEAPKLAIDTFYAFFGDHFEIVHAGYQVLLKKTTVRQRAREP